MTWFGAEIDGPMIVVRTIHFAAAAVTVGALMFRAFVAEPAWRCQREARAIVDSQIRSMAWTGLAVTVASGLTWVLLLTMSLSGEGPGEAVMSGALRDVLNLTQFGWVSQVRLAFAAVLAICLALQRSALCRWIGLVVTMVSGLTWVLLLTMSLSGESLGDAVISGALRDVLNLTQFGLVSQIRLALAIALAICLAFERSALWRRLALIAAVSLVASIAWTGHAASTPDKLGYLHLASDALHLTAASAWVGGLLPLSLLLRAARRRKDWASFELDAVQRFSNLGIASVATLILSGFVNAWILVGSFRGLVVTGYGQLLMLKLAAFAAMLALAAFNRFVLTPRLALASDDARQDAHRALDPE